MITYYDKIGKSIDAETYSELFDNYEYKRVARDVLPNGYVVSTVWLGMDHNPDGGKPHIFETMVFPSEDNFMDMACYRYSNEQDALDGHADAVDRWKA